MLMWNVRVLIIDYYCIKVTKLSTATKLYNLVTMPVNYKKKTVQIEVGKD